MKKLSTILISSVTALVCCTPFSSQAATDYNGTSHTNYVTSGLVSYSNAHDYFSQNGWGQSRDTTPLYKNGVKVSNGYSYYNPEVIGNESAYAWSGTYNSATGFYMDCFVNKTGTTYYSNTVYANGITKSTHTDTMSIPNGATVKYRFNIYWD